MAKSKSASQARKGGTVRPQREAARPRKREQRPADDVRQDVGGNGEGQDQNQLADVVPRSSAEFSIVGVGSLAGGLEAFTQFLHALPGDAGMAIILVQHLSPKHESALPELLAGATSLTVVQVTEGMEIRPNVIYVMPPNTSMGINTEGR